jgi:hypothetical protein
MIDRLDEINRVLASVSMLAGAGPRGLIPIDLVIRLCREAVRDGRFPDHVLTIEFAAGLGFLSVVGDAVEVTSEGRDFLLLNPSSHYELTSEQKRMLVRKHYLGGNLGPDCRRVFKSFSLAGNPPRLVWSELDDAALNASPWLLAHLCQLGLLVRTSVGYESLSDKTETLVQFVEEPKGLTEERLRQLLLEKEAVGDIGEELALAFERDRLKAENCIVEAHCVKRISAVRVNAGYDLESFNGAAPTGTFDRFIEVKSTRGRDLRFFWTENEMKVAEELRHRYWIYFFAGVDTETRAASQKPILFQDPHHCIMHNSEFIKSPQGVLVQDMLQGEQR